ncbi:MAG: hypothetical protein IH991_01345 [Planctomycetes bacterium]|nr:hypothetical protein [Planctomycetota bacterium]
MRVKITKDRPRQLRVLRGNSCRFMEEKLGKVADSADYRKAKYLSILSVCRTQIQPAWPSVL